MGIAMLSVSLTSKDHGQAVRQRGERRYAADAGVAAAIYDLTRGGTGTVGTQTAPVRFGPGGYWTTSEHLPDGTISLHSTGRVGAAARTFRVQVRERRDSVFNHALFAGNSSGDPTYTLELAGRGTAADAVTGDVYSGGSVARREDAAIVGDVAAHGAVSGIAGTTGVTRSAPATMAADFEAHHDVDVAAAFRASKYLGLSVLGVLAWQVPESNPAHIFRLNPLARTLETLPTAKDDYYLDDPYENLGLSALRVLGKAATVSLAGQNGNSGANGTNKVYFIDGNLWVSNLLTRSVLLEHRAGEDVRVTIVAKGNIYLADNVILRDPVHDGIAFVAVRDSRYADSGNIYFGNPLIGKIERAEAYLFAEGNFYDTNLLDLLGPPATQVVGMMAAGDQVVFNRGFALGRMRLELTYDPRITDGRLTLPGIDLSSSAWSTRRFEQLARFEVHSRD